MNDNFNKSPQNELKIIVIGNSGTGKTSFVNKWTKGTFSEFYKATIVSEFAYKIFEHNKKFYRIQLWDLAGQDNAACITKIFAKDSHGCIVLTDISNKESLIDSSKWKEYVDDNSVFMDGSKLPCVLVENKIDLVDEEVLKDDTEIAKFAQEHKYDNFFRTSAKTGIGIDECMEFIIKTILERAENYSKEGHNIFEKERKSIVLDTTRYKNKKAENDHLCC